MFIRYQKLCTKHNNQWHNSIIWFNYYYSHSQLCSSQPTSILIYNFSFYLFTQYFKLKQKYLSFIFSHFCTLHLKAKTGFNIKFNYTSGHISQEMASACWLAWKNVKTYILPVVYIQVNKNYSLIVTEGDWSVSILRRIWSISSNSIGILG